MMRVALSRVKEVPVTALQCETVGDLCESPDDIPYRLVDSAEIKPARRAAPPFLETGIINESP